MPLMRTVGHRDRIISGREIGRRHRGQYGHAPPRRAGSALVAANVGRILRADLLHEACIGRRDAPRLGHHLDDLTSRDRDRARGIGEHEIPRPDPDTVDHHRPVGLERRHHITTRAGRLPRHHVANPNRRNCAKSRNRPSGQAVVLHPRHLRTASQRYIGMPVACQHQHPKLIDPTVPDAAAKVLLDRLAWWACARRTARPALRRLTDLVDGLLGHHLTGSRLN